MRAQPRNSGAARQFTQLGFELIGEGGDAGDVEMVSLVIESLQALGLTSWRIVFGSVRPFMELLARCGDASLSSNVLSLVHANNLVDLDARLAQSSIGEPLRRAISELPRLHGGIEALDRVDELAVLAGIEEPLTGELRALVQRLEQRFTKDGEGASAAPDAVGAQVGKAGSALPSSAAPFGLDGALSFDFSIMNSFDYYTGLVLKVYAGKFTMPLAAGFDSAFDRGVSRARPRAGSGLRLLARAAGGRVHGKRGCTRRECRPRRGPRHGGALAHRGSQGFARCRNHRRA